ncbi:MAG: RNA polymerase sigma factor [Chloroflexales bacterium]|nr:RNA polymerase sigma factor [Chloroflexales bacterium]
MSEADLIHRARQGDEAAWETLVQVHQEPVFRLAYLLLGDADDADDAAQETFIRAFRALASFDGKRPLRPWLLRITTNLAHNRRRSVRRYLAALQRALSLAPEPVEPFCDHSAIQWEAQALWQAVQRLGCTDQEIIYLRYFLDLSEAETARTLEIAPGTVKSRLSRALGRLRTVVDREFPALRQERQT